MATIEIALKARFPPLTEVGGVRFPPLAEVDGDRFPVWRPTSAFGAEAQDRNRPVADVARAFAGSDLAADSAGCKMGAMMMKANHFPLI